MTVDVENQKVSLVYCWTRNKMASGGRDELSMASGTERLLFSISPSAAIVEYFRDLKVMNDEHHCFLTVGLYHVCRKLCVTKF